MRKITEYVVAGVKADNEELFLQRVGELMERYNLLDQLSEGIIIRVYVNDMDKCLDKISQRNNKSWNIIKITGCKVDPDDRIRVKYTYSKECWFKTEEDAEKGSKGWSTYTSDEEKEGYHVKGIYNSSSSDTFSRDEAAEYGIGFEIL